MTIPPADRPVGLGAGAVASGPAILSIWLVFISMVRTPAAIPRRSTATLDMTVFVLGELNRPDPPPIKAMNKASSQYGVPGLMVLNPSRAADEISSPTCVSVFTAS
jgi:hypothetical protein